ncbi:hypothetical protein AYL99_12083 [Fonsecaea erecta]|uniref:Uncharacterized protein n=1 Tax=Fonsecaea erecta TaxID=1367422 RepID=A0A178Z3S5_9EURO|nr:hypothetical protein AYL99_12083 [Fonsecaea erecta]OAP53745.1 hypothetical protein AYL99_12083 [Fonsecaea erecta]
MGDLGTPPMSAFGVRSPGSEGAGVVVKVGSNVKNWKSVLYGLHKTGTYQQCSISKNPTVAVNTLLIYFTDMSLALRIIRKEFLTEWTTTQPY